MSPENDHQMELVYYNGTPITSDNLAVQSFCAVTLNRQDAERLEALFKEAEKKVHSVHSDQEATKLGEYLVSLRREAKVLEERMETDRRPWQKVIDQILDACRPWVKRRKEIEIAGKNYIAEWQAKKIAGRLIAGERYGQKAEVKRGEAQYAEDPKKRQQAGLAAKRYEKEAKEMAKAPVLPGIDTEEYLKDAVILDRRKAAAMDEEAVTMSTSHQWFVKDIAQKKKAGVKVWTHMYPGIELVFGTRVRMPRP